MPRIAGIDKSGASIGAILPHGAGAAPAGFLLCDGTAYSRTTYARLFAAIGTTYGVGDGSTTFNVPNGQGVFLRGAGSQTIGGIAYSATLGSSQSDQFQGHYHNLLPTAAAATVSTGGSFHGTTAWEFSAGSGSPVAEPISGGNGNPRTGEETRPANISTNFIIAYI